MLKDYGLSVTEPRTRILALFLQSEAAITHASIEDTCSDIHRTTVYRTLQGFCREGLIHVIPTTSDTVEYALTKAVSAPPDHIHFACTICGRTFCLEDTFVPALKLPKGYKKSAVHLLITGTCPKCC